MFCNHGCQKSEVSIFIGIVKLFSIKFAQSDPLSIFWCIGTMDFKKSERACLPLNYNL